MRLRTDIHPCAAALVRPRKKIHEEAADSAALAIADFVVRHIGMPDVCELGATDLQAEQPDETWNRSVQHARQREIRAQFFFGEREAVLTQAFGIVRHIPGA
jgi:hypothetical protein